VAIESGSWTGAPRNTDFPAIFFWGVVKMLDRAATIGLIGRIRRAMPRNAEVMLLCDELEGRVVTPMVTPAEVVTSNQQA